MLRDINQKTTASHLLRMFIRSDKFKTFSLLPIDLLILRTICDFLDMPKNECYEKQGKLAELCLIKERYFRDRCEYLVSIGLLFRFFRWRRCNYELGHEITGVKQYD